MIARPHGAEADGAVTEDALLRGRVRLVQPARGFRSSLDPVLLAGFVAAPFGRVLDIGCGTGAVSFLLLARDASAAVTGVELQPRLARCAALGAEASGFGARFSLVEADVRRAALPTDAFDLVVTNPPFRPVGNGVLPADRERAVAHHEVELALAEWIGVARRALSPDGRLGVVFPAWRAEDLFAALASAGFAVTRARLAHPRAGEPATRVLVEARRGTGAPRFEAPLVVHEEAGFSAEVRRWLGEDVSC